MTNTPVTQPTTLAGKLAAVMLQVERVAKTGKNQHFNYDFASYDDFADMIRQALANVGVAFLPSMTSITRQDIKTGGGKPSTLTVVDYDFTFSDGADERTYKWQGEAIDNSDKGLGKATTAAIKTFLKATFLISTGEKEPDHEQEEIEERGAAKQSSLATHKGRAVKAYDLTELKRQVDFLYEGNDFEMDNSIKKHTSGDNPLILDTDNTTAAAAKLVAYKAEQKFGMSKDDIAAALEMTYGDWLKLGNTHHGAWEVFQIAYEAKQAKESAAPKA